MTEMNLDPDFHGQGISQDEWKLKREQLQAMQLEKARRSVHMLPTYYNLPDLMFRKGEFPGRFNHDTMKIRRKRLNYEETDEQYAARQDKALIDFVTKVMFIVKDDKMINIQLTPSMKRLLCDLFYKRVQKVILWANRGGGKSLLAAVFIWLMVVYRKRSCINMGGAGNQARRVYDYTTQFWANVPGLQQGMLRGDPLMERTLLKNGTKLICATSKSSAIGEHIGMFVADEACTDRPGGDVALMRSLQGCLSEDDPVVFLLSTFHLPTGFFAEMWDNAKKQGFTQYRWDCFETMRRCDAGLETATADDPKALDYCKTQCSLTWLEPKKNKAGEIIGHEYVGCVGKARDSDGWMAREKILEAQKINAGTRIFPVEHACIRPVREGSIYDPEMIEKCITPGFYIMIDRPKVVGIDWGLTECALVLIGEWQEYDEEDPTGQTMKEGLGVIDVVFLHGQTTAAAAEQIRKWQLEFGDNIYVRADSSHPYANKDLFTNYGLSVRQVTGDKNNLGKDNVSRWLASGYLRIKQGFPVFVQQLKNLRRDLVTGKQVKDNKKEEEGDHGPDALRFALMNYDHIRWLKKRGMLAVDDDDSKKQEKPSSAERAERSRRRRRSRARANNVARPRNKWRGQGIDGFLV